MKKKYINNIEKYKIKLNKLLTSEFHSIEKIVKGEPKKIKFKGVYIISTPNKQKIVYAGVTHKSIYDRIKDHRNISHKSNLNPKLKLHSDYPQDINNYKVQCLKVTEEKERKLFEHFIISALKPPFNDG